MFDCGRQKLAIINTKMLFGTFETFHNSSSIMVPLKALVYVTFLTIQVSVQENKPKTEDLQQKCEEYDKKVTEVEESEGRLFIFVHLLAYHLSKNRKLKAEKSKERNVWKMVPKRTAELIQEIEPRLKTPQRWKLVMDAFVNAERILGEQVDYTHEKLELDDKERKAMFEYTTTDMPTAEKGKRISLTLQEVIDLLANECITKNCIALPALLHDRKEQENYRNLPKNRNGPELLERFAAMVKICLIPLLSMTLAIGEDHLVRIVIERGVVYQWSQEIGIDRAHTNIFVQSALDVLYCDVKFRETVLGEQAVNLDRARYLFDVRLQLFRHNYDVVGKMKLEYDAQKRREKRDDWCKKANNDIAIDKAFQKCLHQPDDQVITLEVLLRHVSKLLARVDQGNEMSNRRQALIALASTLYVEADRRYAKYMNDMQNYPQYQKDITMHTRLNLTGLNLAGLNLAGLNLAAVNSTMIGDEPPQPVKFEKDEITDDGGQTNNERDKKKIALFTLAAFVLIGTIGATIQYIQYIPACLRKTVGIKDSAKNKVLQENTSTLNALDEEVTSVESMSVTIVLISIVTTGIVFSLIVAYFCCATAASDPAAEADGKHEKNAQKGQETKNDWRQSSIANAKKSEPIGASRTMTEPIWSTKRSSTKPISSTNISWMKTISSANTSSPHRSRAPL